MIKRILKLIIERTPQLAQLYRNSRDILDRNMVSMSTPWGFSLSGHKLMASGSHEPQETKIVRELLNEVNFLVNVGANVGYYCLHALNLVKSVIAIEPIPRNVHYLLRNIHENGYGNLTEVFPVALGAKPDILKMWGGGTGASLIKGWAGTPNSYVTQVPVLTLDRILGNTLENKKTLILVDIEGAEFAMLQGAMHTLRSTPKPIWLIKIGSTAHQPEGIRVNPNLVATFELFFDNGYTAVTADKQQKQILMDDVISVAEGRSDFTVHNFIFR